LSDRLLVPLQRLREALRTVLVVPRIFRGVDHAAVAVVLYFVPEPVVFRLSKTTFRITCTRSRSVVLVEYSFHICFLCQF